jgi:regulator of protease activity HflC (stomatin/prohibitin superfamily)
MAMGSILGLGFLLLIGGLTGAVAFKMRGKLDRESASGRNTLAWTSLGTLGLAAIVAVYNCVIVIPPGSIGVPIFFGKVINQPMAEGLHLVPPWINLQILNVRTQSYTMSHVHDEGEKVGDDSINVLSSNGMEMKLDVTVTYRLMPDAAPWVYRNLGENYVERLIRPGISTAIREAVSKFSDEEVYGAKREMLAQTMQSKLDASIQKTIQGDYTDTPAKVFSISNVLVRNINLPPTVTEGINRKLVMKQESERMEFQIERDRKEAERKVIEAKGIQDSQEIIAKGITPDYLTWKAIEATEMLARSPNAKIIIIGNSRNGLPIMLDQNVPPSPGALTPEEREGHSRHGATAGTNRTP